MIEARTGDFLRTRNGTPIALPPGVLAYPQNEHLLVIVARLGLSDADAETVRSSTFRCGHLEISAVPFFLLELEDAWTAAAPVNGLRYDIEMKGFLKGDASSDVVPVPFVLADAIRPAEDTAPPPHLLDEPVEAERGSDGQKHSRARALRKLDVPVHVANALRQTLRMQQRAYKTADDVQDAIASIRQDFSAEQLAEHADLHRC